MTQMKSRTDNDVKGGQNEKVCLDMNRDWSDYLKLYEHDINNHSSGTPCCCYSSD